MPDLDRTGPWWGSGPMTGRRRGIRNPGLSGLPGVTGVAWTLFKAALTYGVIHLLWLRGITKGK